MACYLLMLGRASKFADASGAPTRRNILILLKGKFMSFRSFHRRIAAAVLVLGGIISQPALAIVGSELGPQDCSPIMYLDRPLVSPDPGAGFSNSISQHVAGGPVLADDFIPAASGQIHCVDWWGTQASSAQWELTLHQGDFGPSPLALPAITGGFKLFATAAGDDGDNNGIFWYHVKINDPDWVVTAGQHYWFSAANLDSDWHWAFADGVPEVGSQIYSGTQSLGSQTCPDGGPHCGAWVPQNEQYAFALQIPEPDVLALFAIGMGAAGFVRRRTALRPS